MGEYAILFKFFGVVLVLAGIAYVHNKVGKRFAAWALNISIVFVALVVINNTVALVTQFRIMNFINRP